MQLTPHFALAEFTRSAKAAQLRLDNTPTGKALENLKRTAEILERVRAHLGVPIIVTSGYRSRPVNSAVGGATSSDHMQGQAADVLAPRYGTPYAIAKALAPHIDALGIGQIIYEVGANSRWVHLSTRVPSKQSNRVITIQVGKGTHLGVQQV